LKSVNNGGGPAGQFDGNVQINGNLTITGQLNGGGGGGVPAGVMMAFAGSIANIPAGWALCDGAAINRTTHAGLFASIGTSWGAGDGSTTFNLPDLRGMFLRGVDGGTGRDPDAASRTASNAGGNTGDNVGSQQGGATKLPNTGFTTSSSGQHTHFLDFEVTASRHAFGPDSNAYNTVANPYIGGPSKSTNAAGDHNHSISGGGDAETRPRNAGVYWIIKVQ
jgi:microcystin-dependent protein